MSGSVRTLAADAAGHLFVGGDFSLAGTNVSPFIAQANVGLGIAGGRLNNIVYSPITGFGFTFGDAATGEAYRIQTTSTFETNGWFDFTNFTYTGPTVINDPSAGTTSNKSYRAITP